jgi:HD-GYP domain-containing protein (c-di-GMP phosphodiesterase class II)
VTGGSQCLEILRSRDVDVVLLDLNMPGLSGEETLEKALEIRPELTVVIVSAENSALRAITPIRIGAVDYVQKPVKLEELTKVLDRAVMKLRKRKELRGAQEVVEILTHLLEAKHRFLQGHGLRVSVTAAGIAKALGQDEAEVQLIRYAALLHDVGRIFIPAAILSKKGPLTDQEFDTVKRHPEWSYRALKQVELLQPALGYVLHHHERIDGRGYPAGIGGGEIPLGARIIAVADSCDAMTSARPYREVMTAEAVRSELEKNARTQWDPAIVEVAKQQLLSA